MSFDLDLYSSTRDALALFTVPPTRLLPVVVSYFDDVLGGLRRIGSLFRNEACGQLLAIREFNAAARQASPPAHRPDPDPALPASARPRAVARADVRAPRARPPDPERRRDAPGDVDAEHGHASEFEWPL